MPLTSTIVGRRIGPIRWTATARRLLAYRAVLAPANAAGLDDSRAGGLCALPTHAATPEWLATLALLENLSATLTESEARQGVHIGQDSVFFRPIHEGDTVETTIEITGLRNTRSGGVTACVFDSRRISDNALLVQTHAATLYRGVEAQDAGHCPRPPECEAPDKAVADINLSYGFAHLYSECAEIWNPIHTEQRAARAAGLDGIIVHGTALWAKAGLALCDLYAKGDARRLKSLSARFAAPVAAGAPLTLCAAPNEEAIDYALRLPDGDVAVAGRARLTD